MKQAALFLTALCISFAAMAQENRLWTNSALGFSMELPRCIEKHPWSKSDDYNSSFRMDLTAENCTKAVDKSVILSFSGSPTPFARKNPKKYRNHPVYNSYQEIQGEELNVTAVTYSKGQRKDGLVRVGLTLEFGCHNETITIYITKSLSPLLIPEEKNHKKLPIPGFPTPKMIEIAKSLKCVEKTQYKQLENSD